MLKGVFYTSVNPLAPSFLYILSTTTTKRLSAGVRAILEFGCSRICFVSGKKTFKAVPLTILNWFVRNRAPDDKQVVRSHHISASSDAPKQRCSISHAIDIWAWNFFPNKNGQRKRRLGCVPKFSREGQVCSRRLS